MDHLKRYKPGLVLAFERSKGWSRSQFGHDPRSKNVARVLSLRDATPPHTQEDKDAGRPQPEQVEEVLVRWQCQTYAEATWLPRHRSTAEDQVGSFQCISTQGFAIHCFAINQGSDRKCLSCRTGTMRRDPQDLGCGMIGLGAGCGFV